MGIHRKAFIRYYHMSTHVPGFQSFFQVFASFGIGQISHQQHKGKGLIRCETAYSINMYRYYIRRRQKGCLSKTKNNLVWWNSMYKVCLQVLLKYVYWMIYQLFIKRYVLCYIFMNGLPMWTAKYPWCHIYYKCVYEM